MKKHKTKIYEYTVVLEPAEEGGYTVLVPSLPGCITEGDTFEQAKKNAYSAIKLYLETLTKYKEPIPEEKEKPITTEVKVRFPFDDSNYRPVYATA